MYLVSSALVIVGFINILSHEKSNKPKKAIELLVFLAVYSIAISLIYSTLGGIASILISIIFFSIASHKLGIIN